MGIENDDDFVKAFDDLAKLGDGENPKEITDEQPVSDESAEVPADAGDEDAGDGAEADADAAPAEDGGEGDLSDDAGGQDEEPAPKPSVKLSDEELLERFAKIVKPEAPQQPQPQQPEPEQPRIYEDDELKAIAEYEKEWPEIARAEMLRRRGEYHQLVNYVFQQVSQQLQPMTQRLNQLSTRTYTSDIYEAVPDYDDIRDTVINWARDERQPPYLRNAYEQVIREGTVQEIADLCDRWKQATGTPAAKKAPAPAVKTDAELPATAKQAAASLAPVRSKRSSVIAGDDPNDFDGAFAEFAKGDF